MRHRYSHSTGPIPKVLAVVLAGGEGTRLWPLTADRAKPAVPFGGSYRIIDFVLSNLVNSGIHRIKVLTQYKSDSLLTHISRGWRMSNVCDHYIDVVPAQQRRGKHWFQGSADALYQSLNVISDEAPDFVCVFGGDHIYKMDVQQMLGFHIEHGAALTIAAVPVPAAEAHGFGVIQVDAGGRMIGFQEKPKQPKEMPGRPGWVLASMGNYIFNASALRESLEQDSEAPDSDHDFGRNIVPMMYERTPVYVYNFLDNVIPGTQEEERGYWKDVGTVESYFRASMDLVSVTPVLNLYNQRWPIHTLLRLRPPAKFVFADREGDRMGMATDSMVSLGCIISGGRINRSILSSDVRINSYAHIEESVLMDGVEVGRYCRIRRAIVDKGVKIPPRMDIGFDPEMDRKRFHVSDGGIVVIPKNYRFG